MANFRELKPILERVRTWPQGAQQAAFKALREIEEDFIIGPATRVEIDTARHQALHDEGVSLDEIKERLGM